MKNQIRIMIPGFLISLILICAIPSSISEIIANEHQKDNQIQQIPYMNNGPNEEWNMTYGGEQFDIFFGVEETSDNGIIALGTTNGRGYYNGGDFFLVKTNQNGQIEWQKTYGGSKTDFGFSVIQTKDYGYILTGITASYGSGQWDIWIVKTDSQGEEEWNTTWGGNSLEQCGHTIIETKDNCYIVSGLTYSFSSGISYDAFLLKIDENGNEVWNKTYNSLGEEHFWDVELTSDGGYILAGLTRNTTSHNAWIVKTDDQGNIMWDKKFGPANQALDIIEADDGGYVFICEAEETCFSGYLNSWLIKIDHNGNKEWDQLFITPKGDDNFAVHHHLLKHNNGGYILTGTTNGMKPIYSVGDLWLTRVDCLGNVIWEKILGGLNYDSTYRVDITADGGYIVAGATESYGAGDFDAWLVKISDMTNQRPNTPSKPEGILSGRSGKEYTYSTSSSDPDTDEVFYIWDWNDGNYSYWLGPIESTKISEATHSWTIEGDYSIRVKVRDVNGGESDWSDPLSISMPRSKPYMILFEDYIPMFFKLFSSFNHCNAL